jgi:hypothetical protein
MFNINGVDWKIKIVSSNHPNLKRRNGSVALGSCDNNTNIIYISESVPDYKLKKVLCHEITHAAMFSYDIIITLEQEELLADLIATYGEEIIFITNKIFKKIKG